VYGPDYTKCAGLSHGKGPCQHAEHLKKLVFFYSLNPRIFHFNFRLLRLQPPPAVPCPRHARPARPADPPEASADRCAGGRDNLGTLPRASSVRHRPPTARRTEKGAGTWHFFPDPEDEGGICWVNLNCMNMLVIVLKFLKNT